MGERSDRPGPKLDVVTGPHVETRRRIYDPRCPRCEGKGYREVMMGGVTRKPELTRIPCETCELWEGDLSKLETIEAAEKAAGYPFVGTAEDEPRELRNVEWDSVALGPPRHVETRLVGTMPAADSMHGAAEPDQAEAARAEGRAECAALGHGWVPTGTGRGTPGEVSEACYRCGEEYRNPDPLVEIAKLGDRARAQLSAAIDRAQPENAGHHPCPLPSNLAGHCAHESHHPSPKRYVGEVVPRTGPALSIVAGPKDGDWVKSPTPAGIALAEGPLVCEVCGREPTLEGREEVNRLARMSGDGWQVDVCGRCLVRGLAAIEGV